MNLLSGSGVLAENKLFATVDSTVRKVVLGTIPFLLSDTVGFIRKLPHHLIESFKSTLDEVREADILIHVVDAAHPFHDNQIQVVSNTLAELGAGNIPTILVLNKIDQLKAKETEEEPVNLEAMQAYYRQQGYEHVVFASAVTGENIPELKAVMLEHVKKRHLQIYPNYMKTGYDYMQDYSAQTEEEE
jgi:GTP-binding protein HflX